MSSRRERGKHTSFTEETIVKDWRSATLKVELEKHDTDTEREKRGQHAGDKRERTPREPLERREGETRHQELSDDEKGRRTERNKGCDWTK